MFGGGISLVPHYQDAPSHSMRSLAPSAPTAGRLFGLQMDFGAFVPPRIDALKLVEINITDGTVSPMTSLNFSYIPLAVAFDWIFVRYFTFNIEAYVPPPSHTHTHTQRF